jgi:endonuclease-3 related protein
MTPPLQQAYEKLLARFGPQHWWPAKTRFEMMIGGILTQNTAWTNVEKAIANLRKADALNFDALEKAPPERIAEWIRPAGYFNQKAGYINEMVAMIGHRFDGSLNRLFALDTPALRKELLSWKGMGPETADSILLYAARRPVFVIDSYTKRVCSRHGWCDKKTAYSEMARLFTDNLPKDVRLYNEYHALIVRLCKEYCNSVPRCEGCPLKSFL